MRHSVSLRLLAIAPLLSVLSACYLHSKSQLISVEDSVNPFGTAEYVEVCLEGESCRLYENFRDNDFRIYGDTSGEYMRLTSLRPQTNSFIGTIGPTEADKYSPAGYAVFGLSLGSGSGQISVVDEEVEVQTLDEARVILLDAAFDSSLEYLQVERWAELSKSDVEARETPAPD